MRRHAVRAVVRGLLVAAPIAAAGWWVLSPIPSCRSAHWTLQTAGIVERATVEIGAPGCDFATSLMLDLVLIAVFFVVLTFVIDRGGRRFLSRPGRRLAKRLRWLPALTAILDLAEDSLMAQWVLPGGYTADYQARWVSALAMSKTALFAVTVAIAVVAVWALADET